MDFEEWCKHVGASKWDIYKLDELEAAYEAGIQEGIDRMYLLHDICPECSMSGGQHKMDCGRGR